MSDMQLEEALRLSDRQMRGIIDATHAHVSVIDQENRYTMVNQHMASDFGVATDAIAGHALRDVIPSELAGPIEANNRAVLTTGTTQEFHEVLPSQDGPRIYLSVKAPIYGPTAAPTGVSCISINVTSRLEAERELHDHDRRKDEFIAILAHELRQPLAAVAAALEVMKYRRSAESVERAQSVIDRQVGHVRRLADDLLESARAAHGKISITRRRLDLNAVARQVVDAASSEFVARRHRFTLTLPSAPVFIEGDSGRLMQVMSNLLTNAAKCSDDGSELSLQVVPDQTHVEIRVRDNGRGIAREDLPHIFEWFVQVCGADRGGLGVGLALVRSLVQRHGGTIEARSDGVGKGSEFVVRLPLCAL